MTRKDLLRITGMTEAKLQHCERVAGIAAAGEDWWRLMIDEAATAQGECREGRGAAAAPHGDSGWPMSDLCDYTTDVAAWAEEQAGLLRRRASGQLPNDAGLDWDNLAEEIEGVAASQKREIRHRLKVHLPASPEVAPQQAPALAKLAAHAR